jgi:uncharacterized membrane-anchored protein
MRRELVILACVVPLLTIVLGIVRAERHLARSRDFTFDLEGYDPRDLLRGHYIQYRIAWHEDPRGNDCHDGAEGCCLCLTERGSNLAPQVIRMDCSEGRSACDGVLDTRYLSTLQRYYIPEARADELTQRLARATRTPGAARAVLAIDGRGKPQVKALRIDGKDVLEPRR